MKTLNQNFQKLLSPIEGDRQQLLTTVTALTSLYLALILGFGWSRDTFANLGFLALAGGTAVGLILLRYLAGRPKLRIEWLESVGTIVAGLVLTNTALFLYVTTDLEESRNLVLLGIGILAFFLNFRRLTLVLLVSLLAWLVVEWTWGSTSAWLHYAFGLLVATGMKLPAELRDSRARYAADALSDSQERYALAEQITNDALWEWQLDSDSITYSPRWAEILGLASECLTEEVQAWLDRIHPDDLVAVKASLTAHWTGKTEHLEIEYRLRHEGGDYIWIRTRGLTRRNEEGHPIMMAGSHANITERKLREIRLLTDGSKDPLTELPNRFHFEENVERALARQRRRKSYLFAVLFADLDRFKVINDSLGHLIGDRLLKKVARRLTACVRSTDIVSRFGGDEFAIFLEDLPDSSHAVRCAQRIEKSFEQEFDLEESEVYTSTSIGIVLANGQYRGPKDLLRDAETAMYRAKQRGRSRYEIFDPEMHDLALETLELDTGLRRAVQRQEFLLHHQPILDLDSRQIIASEALLRWENPEKGLLFPSRFLRAAEESGLILPIGGWVLKQACRDAVAWGKQIGQEFGLAVNVNVSARQFAEPNFTRQVNDALIESGLAPKQLRLEITEAGVMETGEEAIDKLRTLKDSGVRVYLDDFGTGYSSLKYLQRLPIDGIKIDRSFTSQLDSEERTLGISKVILQMGEMFGLDVTAEGVETERQLELLTDLSCPTAQGNYFCRPMSSEAFSVFLALRSENDRESNVINFRKPTPTV